MTNIRNLGRNAKVDVISAGSTASATTTLNSVMLDMMNYEGVLVLGNLSATATDNGLFARMATSSATTGLQRILDSFATATSTSLALEINRPKQRWLMFSYLRTTTAKAGPLWAIRYQARQGPVDNATSTSVYKFLASPSTGAATATA